MKKQISLSEFKYSKSDGLIAQLRAMEVSLEECETFELKQRNTIACSITRLKNEEGLRFITRSDGSSLYVWRIA